MNKKFGNQLEIKFNRGTNIEEVVNFKNQIT